jgi:1,4-dihydroxy-2-naphthoate polyprenyltransferase
MSMPSFALRLFVATRPTFLTISVVGCLIGFAAAYASGKSVPVSAGLIALLIAITAQASANVINDYCDSRNGSDDKNIDRIFPFTGGSRVIQEQWLSPTQVKRYGYAILALCAVLGLWLVASLNAWALIWIGLLGLLLAWGYSSPPLALMSRGIWGEIAIMSAWALIVIGCAMLGGLGISGAAVIPGLAFGAMVANILYMNQIPDILADREAKKRTLAVMTPTEKLWVWHAVFMLLGYALVVIGVWLRLLPLYCLACWLALPFFLSAQRTTQRSPADRAAMTWGIQKNIAGVHLFGILLALGLYLS